MGKILSDEDRAQFDTPPRRMKATQRAVVLMIKEFGLTQSDVDFCREDVRRIAELMSSNHARVSGAGETIDDVRAMCAMFDAIFEYMRRGE